MSDLITSSSDTHLLMGGKSRIDELLGIFMDGSCISYISPKERKEIYRLIREQYPSDYNEEYKRVLFEVMTDGLYLGWASLMIRDDFEIVLYAVEQNGKALQYASERLKNNRDIVLAAVKENGNALRHASASMKDDEFIVHEAVKNNNHRVNLALSYASKRLQGFDFLINQ